MRPSPGYPPATPEHAFFNKIGGEPTLRPLAYMGQASAYASEEAMIYSMDVATSISHHDVCRR